MLFEVQKCIPGVSDLKVNIKKQY